MKCEAGGSATTRDPGRVVGAYCIILRSSTVLHIILLQQQEDDYYINNNVYIILSLSPFYSTALFPILRVQLHSIIVTFWGLILQHYYHIVECNLK